MVQLGTALSANPALDAAFRGIHRRDSIFSFRFD
jgi:hypothetical protein